MCNPMLAMMGVSLAMGATSAYQQQKAANKAAELNKKMAEQNAAIAEAQAVDVEERGKLAEDEHRDQVARFKGSQRAGFAASGVLVDEGSSADVLVDTAGRAEADVQTIRRNAAMDAWSLRQTGKNYTLQGQLHEDSKSSPFGAAATSVLTNGSSLAASYISSGGYDSKKKIEY